MVARRGNDTDELRRVYRAHVRAVFAFFAYSVSREVAEDLTAATFERVVKAWARFDPAIASERTWILTIARNVLTDYYRRQSHRGTVSTDEHPALLEAIVAVDDPITRHLSTSGFTSWLRELNDREQQVLALRYGADLSAREIAATLSLSEPNVHQISSRALRRLRDIARQRGVTGSDDRRE